MSAILAEGIEAELWAASLGALRRLTDSVPLDLDCAGPRRERSGAVCIRARLTHMDLAIISRHPEVRVRAVTTTTTAVDGDEPSPKH